MSCQTAVTKVRPRTTTGWKGYINDPHLDDSFDIEIVEMRAWKFIAQGDDLAVWGHQRFRRRATGHEWDSEFAHIITLRDGKWWYFRDFMNSALTDRAFSTARWPGSADRR